MAQIVVNEISQNYTYNIGKNTFATVALPITASWGPAYMEPTDGEFDEMLELTQWQRFSATQQGLETFVSTYRGPASNYRLVKDFSYQMAMTLLTAGYDVLTCRVCPGDKSEGTFVFGEESANITFTAKAKYPGSFGDNIKIMLTPVQNRNYWNLVVYVVDNSGIQTAVENLIFVFNEENSTDSIPYIDEVESNFLTFETNGVKDTMRSDFTGIKPDTAPGNPSKYFGISENGISKWVRLYGGTDDNSSISNSDAEKIRTDAYNLALTRYTGSKINDIATGAGYSNAVGENGVPNFEYLKALKDMPVSDMTFLKTQYHKEWCYSAAFLVYQLLKDKLNYNPQRIISPGWDDQDIHSIDDSDPQIISQVSPLHKIIMETAYYSRCATGMIDIPKSCSRKGVYNDSATTPGYAQLLSRVEVAVGGSDVNAILYNTHAALFAPWGQYKYVGTGKQNPASPSFIALLIQRAQILNQPLQYEWALPTNRKHNLKLGKFDYKVPKKLLDVWQKLEGVGVNVLTEIPELGVNLWGNSTLFEVPPATYQALANLSTRYLVNAVEDIAYKCGISITFQYNNEQAYNKFYAGVTPILDTMKNVGAIDDYYVKMAADINGLDQVNANTVIGKIYLVVNGVINDIIIDLIALPPGVDLNQYKS